MRIILIAQFIKIITADFFNRLQEVDLLFIPLKMEKKLN